MIFHTPFQKSLKEFLLASHCFQLPFCSWIKHSLFPFIFTSQLFPQTMNDCRSRLKLLSPALITGLSFITNTYCTVTSRICCVCVMLAHLLLSVIKFQWEAQSHANDPRVPAREWSGLSINVLKGTHELLEHFFLLLFTFCETTINAPLSHQYVFTYSLLYYRFDLLYKNKQTK